jgi:hypothetical protein
MTTKVLLELPEEGEIETVEEARVEGTPGLIKKTIRYRNGVVATLYQDFREAVFSVTLKAADPFWMSQNQVLKAS